MMFVLLDINTTDVIRAVGIAYHPGVLEFTIVLLGMVVLCPLELVFEKTMHNSKFHPAQKQGL